MIALALPLLLWAAHPDSLSSSRVVVAGSEARVELRCQVASLLEVVDGLDADGDGAVTAEEVAHRQAGILAYAAEHYVLRTGTDRDLKGGAVLVPLPVGVRRLPSDPDIGPGPVRYRDWVDIEILYRADRPILDLALEVTLFWRTSPDHIDYASIEWPSGVVDSFALDRTIPAARSDPQGRGAFGVFVPEGVRHILGGWDHLAFLVALLLSARSLRSLVGVVTAFTLAHSLTLALASLGVASVSAYSAFIEQAIALTIAYVAADNLLHPASTRARWPEAFLFGLIHGLGFAGFLAESLIREHAKLTALFAFNVGVEAGQIAVVVALALLLRFLPQPKTEVTPFLAPRWVRRTGSAALLILGLYWFLVRI